MNYDDIINIKSPIPLHHKRMSAQSRASIFAPFAALSGHSEALDETARLTSPKIELTNDTKEMINRVLNVIKVNIKENLEVSLTYFIQDKYKSGGKYITIRGIIKKIDSVNKKIILMDRTIISLFDLVNIKIMKKIDTN